MLSSALPLCSTLCKACYIEEAARASYKFTNNKHNSYHNNCLPASIWFRKRVFDIFLYCECSNTEQEADKMSSGTMIIITSHSPPSLIMKTIAKDNFYCCVFFTHFKIGIYCKENRNNFFTLSGN